MEPIPYLSQAIRVEFLESNAITDAPEPATLGLAGSVLLALGIAHRKRRAREA